MRLGFEIDEAYESEFATKCEEIAIYQAVERTTLDKEWTEEELKSDIYDVCKEVMTDSIIKKYEFKAVRDKNLFKCHYMAERISEKIEDVIELYNKEYDKHRNDGKFGIVWYDEAIKKMIMKELKENIICG